MTSPALLAPPAGRQGPGPIAARLVEALDLVVRAPRRRAAARASTGAPGVGAGTELAALRAYQPGDDVRQLDPAATARTGEPHVRLDVPERLVTTWLVLDVSPSMAFGTAERLKADVAEGAVRVLARLATRRGGRVALMVVRRRARAACCRRAAAAARARRVERAAARGRGAGRARRPATASSARLVRLGRMARLPGLVAVVSDFRGRPELARPLRALWRRATRWSPSRCATRARPRCPPWAGCARDDPETGAQVEVDTRDRAPARALRGARAGRARRRAAPSCARPERTTSCSPRTRPGCATSAAASRRSEAGAGELPGAALPARARRRCRWRAAAYALARRRRRRYAVRFTGRADAGRRSSDAVPAWRRHLPAALFAAGAGRARDRARAPAGHRGGAGRAGLGPARDRRLGLDAGRRRGAHPARRGAQAPRSTSSTACRTRCAWARWPSPPSPHTLDRPGDRPRRGGGADREPDAPTAARPRATRSRQALELLGTRESRQAAAAPRSCCSPTARPPPAATPWRWPAQARRARVPVYTVALGTSEGVIDDARRAAARAARPGDDARDRRACPAGEAFTAEDDERLDAVYKELGSQIGSRREQREITAGLRGRRARAAARRGGPGACAATGGSREHAPRRRQALDRRPAA